MAGGVMNTRQAEEATSRQFAAALRDLEEETRLRRGTGFHGEIELKLIFFEGHISAYELAPRKIVRTK